MEPAITYRTLPPNTSVLYPGRVIRMGVLHHSGKSAYDPIPTANGSWDRTFKQDGGITVWNDDSNRATFHTLNTLRWRPPAVATCPDGRVSDANFSARGYEIQYDPDAGEIPTVKQHASLKWQLGIDHAKYGPIVWVGHGQIDSTKRPTEPTGLDWNAIGCQWVAGVGYLFSPPSQEDEVTDPISEDDFKSYMEIYGYGANPATAIFQRALLAYRRGERRGPFISDEYAYTTDDGRDVVRQKLTSAIAEYDPATGGVAFAEIVLKPE